MAETSLNRSASVASLTSTEKGKNHAKIDVIVLSSSDDEEDTDEKKLKGASTGFQGKEINGKEFLDHLGLSPNVIKNITPIISKKDIDSTLEIPLKIIETHSLAPNLWTESEPIMPIDMTEPSTSNSLAKDEKNLDLDILESFLKDARAYCRPKDLSDVDKITEKLRKKAGKCPKEYLSSLEFIDKSEKVLRKMRNDRDNFFVYIKEMFDEINRCKNRKIPEMSKGKIKKPENGDANAKGSSSSSNNLENPEKIQRKLDKIYKALQKLERCIKKLETKELSLEEMEEDNSHYIYEQKLKQKYMSLYKLACKLENKSDSTGRAVHSKLIYNGSRIPEINKRVQKFINKDKGTRFPDFTDIFNIVKNTNQDSQLNLTEKAVESLAREVFEDVGKELQSRRKTDFKESLVAYLPDDDSDQDPASKDVELKEKLQKNNEIGQEKMNELIETFTEKQAQLKEEPKDESDDEKNSSEKEEGEGSSDDEDDEDEKDENEINEDEKNDSQMEDDVNNLLKNAGENSDVEDLEIGNEEKLKDDAKTKTVLQNEEEIKLTNENKIKIICDKDNSKKRKSKSSDEESGCPNKKKIKIKDNGDITVSKSMEDEDVIVIE